MSRIGKKPIPLPSGVKYTVQGNTVLVEGPKGKVTAMIADGITRGEHQDRDLRALAAEHSGYLEAGTIRQANVEDDRVQFGRRGRYFEAILRRQSRLNDVAVLGQQPLEKPAQTSVVLDD